MINCCKRFYEIQKSWSFQFALRVILIVLPLMIIIQDLITKSHFQTMLTFISQAILIALLMIDLLFIRLSILKLPTVTQVNIVDMVMLLIGYLILFFLLFKFQSSKNNFLEPINLLFLCLIISKEFVKLLDLIRYFYERKLVLFQNYPQEANEPPSEISKTSELKEVQLIEEKVNDPSEK